MSLASITATLILLAGVIDDLRSRKFHNQLFLVTAAVAFAVATLTGGVSGLASATIGFIAGLAVLLPLVLLGVIGAGDMKLMASFGAIAGWNVVIDVAVLSLIWGALFGLLQVIFQGRFSLMVRNMLSVVSSLGKEKNEAVILHKIPFTVGLLMGWLTHLVRTGVYLW